MNARVDPSWRLVTGGTIAMLLPLVAAACGSDKANGAGAKAPSSARVETLVHEDCPESGNRVDALDTNGDGKADIRKVFDKSSGHELCRVVDLNHDGKPDLYEYFDGSGTVRRREFCYDDAGTVNAIEHYQAGKLLSREYDAAGQLPRRHVGLLRPEHCAGSEDGPASSPCASRARYHRGRSRRPMVDLEQGTRS